MKLTLMIVGLAFTLIGLCSFSYFVGISSAVGGLVNSEAVVTDGRSRKISEPPKRLCSHKIIEIETDKDLASLGDTIILTSKVKNTNTNDWFGALEEVIDEYLLDYSDRESTVRSAESLIEYLSYFISDSENLEIIGMKYDPPSGTRPNGVPNSGRLYKPYGCPGLTLDQCIKLVKDTARKNKDKCLISGFPHGNFEFIPIRNEVWIRNGESNTLQWQVVPKSIGEQFIEMNDGLELFTKRLVVTDSTGFPNWMQGAWTLILLILGPTITIPWWYDRIRELRNNSKRKKLGT